MKKKPGYKTTEFWLTFGAEVLNALTPVVMQHVALPPGVATIIYTIARAYVKG